MNRRIFQIQYEVNYGGEIAYHEEMVTTSGVIGVVEQYALEEVKTYWPDDTTWIESDRCGERGDGCARIRVSQIEEVICCICVIWTAPAPPLFIFCLAQS